MRDIGHEETDKLIEQLEKRITREYSQAEKELQAKLDDYFRRFRIKDEAWQRMVANGEKTQADYLAWRQSQMLVGERWKAMREQIATDMHNANALARGMIAGDMPLAWAANANWATYQIEHDAGVSTGFTLYNRDSAMVLLKDEPELLKPPGKQMQRTFDEWDAYRAGQAVDLTPEKQAAFDRLIARGKDIRWQEGQIQSITLQSILQGESIPNMTKRIAETLGEINHKSTIRYARTAMTSAQEQGRAHAYQRAEDMGIDMKREWRAVFDMRTRHAHRQLDGQLRGIDEPFEVDGEEIMFPGDPAAPGYLIYNCRCRTTAAVKGWDKQSRQLRSDDAVGGMSYDEWRKGHSISQPIDKQEKIGVAMRNKTIRTLYGGSGGGVSGIDRAKIGGKSLPSNSKNAKIEPDRFGTKELPLPDQLKKALDERFERGSDVARQVYDRFIPRGGRVENGAFAGTAHMKNASGAVWMNFEKDATNSRGPGTTWLHEHWHSIDRECGWLSTASGAFRSALMADVRSLERRIKKEQGFSSIESARMMIGNELTAQGDVTASIQDIFGGTLGRPYPMTRWAHRTSYWKSGWDRLPIEAFAHMGEACFDPQKMELMKKYFPTAWETFMKMLEGL